MARKGGRIAFSSLNCRALRQRGLTGEEVNARLEGSTLILSDEEGRSTAIAAAQVDRLRQLKMGPVRMRQFSQGAIYETKIWWEGGKTPVLLIPLYNIPVYKRIVRTFAGQVAAAGGIERLMLGPGYTTAIINLMIVVPPLLLLLALVLWLAITDGGLWWIGLVAVVPLFGWLAGRNIVSRWPRRLGSLDKLDAELS